MEMVVHQLMFTFKNVGMFLNQLITRNEKSSYTTEYVVRLVV